MTTMVTSCRPDKIRTNQRSYLVSFQLSRQSHQVDRYEQAILLTGYPILSAAIGKHHGVLLSHQIREQDQDLNLDLSIGWEKWSVTDEYRLVCMKENNNSPVRLLRAPSKVSTVTGEHRGSL